jgi:hypothetical protein
MRTQSLRRELLAKLLEAYELSACYARPGPWPRDIIIKLDSRAFPEAFAPDGRERRASLMFAVSKLECSGCIPIVRHARGPLHGEPKEIRLGPDHVERAYQEGQQLGYEPLAWGLAEVDLHAGRLANESTPRGCGCFLKNSQPG